MIQMFLMTGLEQIIQSYLRLDQETLQKITTLTHKVIHIHIKDWNIHCYIFPNPQGVRLQSHFEGTPDVSIVGTLAAFARMVLSKDPSLKLPAGLEIIGDTSLAQTFSHIALQSRIDWEEMLSMLTGDGIAHQLTKVAKNLKIFKQQIRKNIATNVTEYLQEEMQCAPSHDEMEDFLGNISTLKNDTDRLIAKFRMILS